VDQNLVRMREVLSSGDTVAAELALAADDDIDAMNVSLTERCYELLLREQPMASDLRLVVSVIRVISELERIGDLALRVVKAGVDQAAITGQARSYDILQVMATEAVDRFQLALRAWATEDLGLATELVNGPSAMDMYSAQLIESLVHTDGQQAVSAAIACMVAGQALSRIADHASIMGSRLRYLITGDPQHLAVEVRR
jgi:phosphate transport system protein